MEAAANSVTYIGVRKRKWGKWVSEIREPGKKSRIWLGSFESPEMAAAAHDVASLLLRGRNARLNFPESANRQLPVQKSSDPDHIRSAALEAALQVKTSRRASSADPELSERVDGYASGSDSSGLDCDAEWGLDPAKMWRELAEALLLAPPQVWSYESEVEDFEQGSLWGPLF